MIGNKKQQKSGAINNRSVFLRFRTNLFIFSSLLAICISVLSPLSAFAVTTMNDRSDDLLWQAQSHYYYDAISECISHTGTIQWNTGENDVSSGKLFRQWWTDASVLGYANGFIMRDRLGDVGDDGKQNCNANDSELIRNALSHWGLSTTEFACDALYERDNGTDCKNGNGKFKIKYRNDSNYKDKLKTSFQNYIKNKVFEGKEPTSASQATQYIYFKETFLKGCAYKARGLTEDQKPGGNNVYVIGEVNASAGIDKMYYVGTEPSNKNRPIWSNPNREWSCGDIANRIGPSGDLTKAYRQWYENAAKKDPTLTPNPDTGKQTNNETKSSCTIDGIGWIICPTVLFLSDIADKAYIFLADNFLSTSPRLLDQGGPAYTAWQSFLTIGNIIFVIAFIVIVYSQITGYGVSNYGVKRMLPRLIVCAILINLSFIICQLAVDISNILGYSLKSFLASAPAIDTSASAQLEGGRWSAMAVTVLAGAGVATGLSVGVFGLLAILAAAVVSLLMIFFILTLRQVFIILLVVIAPIAFAAFLLPNTEQFFTKWRKTFIALLMVFPIIGIVYGASSLASGIITSVYNDPSIDQAGQLGSIIGAGVLVIPLFAVPFLLKQSLNSLGSLGGKINAIGSSMSGRARNGVTNSGLAKYHEAKRQHRKAMVAGGVDISGGGGKNPLNWKSRFNRGITNRALGGYGDQRAAQGISIEKEFDDQKMNEATALLKGKGLTADQMQAIALGKDANGNPVNIKGVDTKNEIVRRAALKTAMAQNGLEANEQLIAASGSMSGALRNEVAQGVLENKLGSQAGYLGGDMADKIKRGEVNSQADLDLAAADRIRKGKTSAEMLANQDPAALKRYSNVINNSQNGRFTAVDGDKNASLGSVDMGTQQVNAVKDQAFEIRRDDGKLKNTITGEQARHIENIDISPKQ